MKFIIFLSPRPLKRVPHPIEHSRDSGVYSLPECGTSKARVLPSRQFGKILSVRNPDGVSGQFQAFLDELREF